MRVKSVVYDKAFLRQLKKYTKRLPDKELAALKERLKTFQNNVFDTRLDTHKLRGSFAGYWAFSLNDSDRVIFRFLTGNEVLFIDIDDHSVYR